MKASKLRSAARRELDASKAWWSNDENFQPLLPPALAARLRAPLYTACIVGALVVLGRLDVLPVEINPDWRAYLLPAAIAVAGERVCRWCDRRDAAAAARPPQPAPQSAEPRITQPIAPQPVTGITQPLDEV